MGLAPVSDVQRYIFTDRPWLAADPTLAPWPDPADPTVFQTGAWILLDQRPLSRELETFLETGEPPVYFGFGSMRAWQDLSQVMNNHRAGDTVRLTIYRDKKKMDVSVMLGEAREQV